MKKPAGPCNMHKRAAMGGNIEKYASGGSVGRPELRASAASKEPLSAARRNNGVKGMKEGGKC